MPPARAGAVLIAHRGESFDAPENTLAAVNLAWSRGAAAVEIDVRMSADGGIVVSHDPDVRKIGGGGRRIRSLTLAELHQLDAGAWKNPRWAGERVPLLNEVLATVPARGRLFVEMKEGPETVPPSVKEIRRAKLRPQQVLVMSFVETTVAATARALPDHEVVLLVRARDYVGAGRWRRVIERAKALGARGVNPEVTPALTAARIAAAHAAGLTVYTWTVNRLATAMRLQRNGIDGITTDRCAWMREQMERALAAAPAATTVKETGNPPVL